MHVSLLYMPHHQQMIQRSYVVPWENYLNLPYGLKKKKQIDEHAHTYIYTNNNRIT